MINNLLSKKAYTSTMQDEWLKLEAEDAARILDEINPHIDPVPFSQEATTIRVQKLPFYKDHRFYELTDFSAVPGARKYAIYKPGDVNIITWTNQAIYDVNEKAPILLTEENVADYARFFFSHVRGRHGRFLIVEAVDDIKWQVEPPPQGRKIMQEMLKPVSLLDIDKNKTYNLEAYMVFKDSLFKTRIHVGSDGLISLSDEELKVEGIPVLFDTFVA